MSSIRAGRNQGFTLLELLVTLSIIAVAIAATTLALRPDGARLLASEAERLSLLLEQAQEEAELSGQPLAWVAGDHHYAFERRELTRNGPIWSPVTDDHLWRMRTLPEGLEIDRVEADRQQIAAGERLLLDSFGFRQVVIELSLGRARARILGDGEGFVVSSLSGAGT